MIADAWKVAAKDLRSEWRTKESLNAALAVTVVLLLLFSFAFDPGAEDAKLWAGGLLWLVYSFAAALIVNRGFARELSNDCLEALRASPIPPGALFLGKAFAGFVLLLAVELAALPAFLVFYNVSLTWHAGWVALAFALATWGIVVLGTMFGALTVNLEMRELMLPVLIYPMMMPALVAAIEITGASIQRQAIPEIWLRSLTGFDIIFTALAVLLADVVLVD